MSQSLTPETLRARRVGLGLTFRALADTLGVENSTIYRWEAGRTRIKNPEMLHLALTALEERRVLENILHLLESANGSKPFLAALLRETLTRFDARDTTPTPRE